ncbi:MAG TPA: S8 family serine peptidase, partial [bacterium]|nr:S8 family serine peptidase [bacterium]
DPDTTIGFLGGGVDAAHADLKGRNSYWIDFTADGELTPVDYDGHDTLVAAIAAGTGAAGGADERELRFTFTYADAEYPSWGHLTDPFALPARQTTVKTSAWWTPGQTCIIDQWQWTRGTDGATSTKSVANFVRSTSPGVLTNTFTPSVSNIYSSVLMDYDTRRPVENVTMVTSISPYPGSGDTFNKFSGVAPGCKWAAVKVFDREGSASSSNMTKGLDEFVKKSVEKNIKIVNISIGGTPGGGCPVQYQDIFDQMYNAGITVFVAAGNDGSNNGISPLAECDNVIAVGAVDESANRASYSNAGNGLSLVAPGGDTTHSKGNGVLSTVRNDSTSASTAYEYMQGTSMSSPHAAGVAALMLAANSSLSPLQIATILSQTSSDLGAAGTDIYYGAGLINAFKAVSEAKRLTGSSPDIPAGAVISLSSSNLYFNYGETSKTILITNTGATALSITSITDTENSGGNWMSLSSQSDSNRTALTVNINRTGLSAGEYHGYIQIQSNGGNSSIPVTIVAEGSGPSAPLNCSDSTLNAVAYGISSGSIVSSITFPYAVSTFNLLEVPAGSYRIYVTTDCDGDGSLCEAGDICGSYNSGATVAVTGKQYTSNININLTRQSSAVSAFKR